MKNNVEQLVTYIQENCLWQFFSRSWDREENIEGIINGAAAILTGEEPAPETAADRCFIADARVLAGEFRSKFPWICEISGNEVKDLLNEVKDRLRHITVTQSLNAELKVPNY